MEESTVSPKKQRPAPIYRKMRDMEVNTTMTVPIERWDAARSNASVLHRYFGVSYTVHKLDEFTVTITRLD